MFTQSVFNIFIFIINKNTTPCHILIMIIIGLFAPYIKALTNDTKSSIIIIIGLLVILFLVLVFNEILEVNCFGLQKNTKKNISIRAGMDLSVGLNNSNNEDDNDDSDDSDSNIDDISEKKLEKGLDEIDNLNDSQSENPSRDDQNSDNKCIFF